MKLAFSVLLILIPKVATALVGSQPFFEQLSAQTQTAWQTRGARAAMLVTTNGFGVRYGEDVLRFRWHGSMGLTHLAVAEALPSFSSQLGDPGGRLAHARRLTASNADGSVKVQYYFGARGLELDVELGAGGESPMIELHSLDADFALSQLGNVTVAGRSFALRPVAYTIGGDGRRSAVESSFSLSAPRDLALLTDEFDRGERKLVIDPVVTFESYFGDDPNATATGIRELADGSLLLVGGLGGFRPAGAVVGSSAIPASSATFFGPTVDFRCFVARVQPSERKNVFVTYLGPSTGNACAAMDVDSEERIILIGNFVGLPEALDPSVRRPRDPLVLARVTSDGAKADVAFYAQPSGHVTRDSLRAVGGDAVYLASGCGSCRDTLPAGFQREPGDILITRFDLSTGEATARTYLGGAANLGGIRVSATGVVYAFGSDAGLEFPEASPLDGSFVPDSRRSGFVAALSPDLERLLFSTRIGGDFTRVVAVEPHDDGSVWVAGNARAGDIPGFQGTPPERAPFAFEFTPGRSELTQFFWPTGLPSDPPQSGLVRESYSGLTLADGRFCALGSGQNVVVGSAAFFRSADRLACENGSGEFPSLTDIGSGDGRDVVLTSANSEGSLGVWVLGERVQGDPGEEVIPSELRLGAVQASGQGLTYRHISLDTPKPVLHAPDPVALDAVVDRFHAVTEFRGENFAEGMLLELEGLRLPFRVLSPFLAELRYTADESRVDLFREEFLAELRPGHFEGRLVIPTQAGAVRSDPFPVTVNRLRPSLTPFLTRAGSLVVNLASPTYAETEVRWNGQRLPLRPGDSPSGYFVEVPRELGLVGEMVVMTPAPGGGVQRADLRFGPDTRPAPIPPPRLVFDGDRFAVDRSRRRLYTIDSVAEPAAGTFNRTEWAVSAYDLLSGDRLGSTTMPRGAADHAIGFEISSDGRFIYVLDDLYRVLRFQAETLERDLEFEVPIDGSASYCGRFCIRAVPGRAESILLATAGGRLVVYDDDRPRPYTTSDFPSEALPTLLPLLVGPDYVYARHRSEGRELVRCLARYPLDSLGFGYPEELCRIERGRTEFSELSNTGIGVVLGNESGQVPALELGSFGLTTIDGDIAVQPDRLPSVVGRRARIVFKDAPSGRNLGHHPITEWISGLVTHAIAIGNEALVYQWREPVPGGGVNQVVVVPAWKDQVEWY